MLVTTTGLFIEALWLAGLVVVLGLASVVMAGFENMPLDIWRTALLAATGLGFSALTFAAAVITWRLWRGADVSAARRAVLVLVGAGNLLIAAYAFVQLVRGPADGPAFFGLVLVGAATTGAACLIVATRNRIGLRESP
jgi:hypothetical protein